MNSFKCKYCGKEFENSQKLGGHIIWCKLNPNYEKNVESYKNRKITKNNYICKYCGEEFSNKKKYNFHEKHCDKNPTKLVYNKGQAWNKGLTKETSDIVKQYGNTYSTNYYKGQIKIWCKDIHLDEDIKNKISCSMVLAHKEKRAWHIGTNKWRKLQSYPEYFFETFVIPNVNDKNYLKEFKIYRYYLDFAWEHKNKCIEIDGEQHQRFERNIERDKRKDKYLNDNGWEVLRIESKYLINNLDDCIKLVKNFIDI